MKIDNILQIENYIKQSIYDSKSWSFFCEMVNKAKQLSSNDF